MDGGRGWGRREEKEKKGSDEPMRIYVGIFDHMGRGGCLLCRRCLRARVERRRKRRWERDREVCLLVGEGRRRKMKERVRVRDGSRSVGEGREGEKRRRKRKVGDRKDREGGGIYLCANPSEKKTTLR